MSDTIFNSAVLDSAHTGDIEGAFGTIRHADHHRRQGWAGRLRTLAAILGPGLIVMVGDNDAGAFGTYTQAGQNYGTALMWTLLLLVPVLYVNQEMVLRLGCVTARRPCPADPGALRQILGRVQRHRPVPAERADDRHRVHRHQPRAGLSRGAADRRDRCGGGDHHRRGRHR